MPSKSSMAMLLGGTCMILAIIARALNVALPLIRGGVGAMALLVFADTLFLIGIYFYLVEKS